MEKETDFYTATMAQVYSEQGHWNKAAEIYRHLLTQEPEREDYLAALARVERKAGQNHNESPESLSALFHQWFDLMLKYKNMGSASKIISNNSSQPIRIQRRVDDDMIGAGNRFDLASIDSAGVYATN